MSHGTNDVGLVDALQILFLNVDLLTIQRREVHLVQGLINGVRKKHLFFGRASRIGSRRGGTSGGHQQAQ